MQYKQNVDVEEFFQNENGLCSLHWEEIAVNKSHVKLNPDILKYKALQDLGILKNVVAYTDEGEMVGYSVLLIQPHLHYKDDLYAFVDVIYLDPAFRSSRVGIKLVQLTEEVAKEYGASVIVHHTKPHHRNLEEIIKRKGYKLIETMYSKLLKE